MTITPNAIATTPSIPLDTGVPARPPAPALDPLDGFLDAYLAHAVKPHRERLVDILRVIENTPSGRTLLDHFRDRALQGNALVVNLLAPGTPLPEGAAAHDLWLNEADLTSHAQQIGVPPEVQYAPSVFQSLSMARMASLDTQHADSTPQHYDDPAMQALQERFRQEMSVHGNTLSGRMDRAQTVRAMQSAGSIPDMAMRMPRNGSAPSSLGAADPATDSRKSSAASRNLLPIAAAPSASNGQGNSADTASAAKSTKPRRRLTQWVSKRFSGLIDTVARLRRDRQAARTASVPQSDIYRGSSASNVSQTSTGLQGVAAQSDAQSDAQGGTPRADDGIGRRGSAAGEARS